MAEQQIRVIKVIGETSGESKIAGLSAQFAKLNKNISDTRGTMSGIKSIFSSVFAGISVIEIARISDSFQLLQDRIKVFTGSTESAKQVFDDLFLAAKYTKTSVDTLAEAYNRVAVSTSSLGLSNEQILATVISLQQALRLSGASAQESSSVFLQFSQALSLGRFQGQELRAIMLSSSKMAKILAESLGVTAGELKLLGEQGKITSSVVLNGLFKYFKQLNIEAGQLSTTFEQATIIAFDNLKRKVKDLNEAFSLSTKYAEIMNFAVSNLDTILLTVGISTIPLMIRGMKALTAALAANPITIVFVGLSLAIATLATNWDKSLLVMEKTWLRFVIAWKTGVNEITGSTSFWDKMIGKITAFATAVANAQVINDRLVTQQNKISGISNTINQGEATTKSNTQIDQLKNRLAEVNGQIEKIDKNGDPMADLLARINKGMAETKKLGGGTVLGEEERFLSALNKQYQKLGESFAKEYEIKLFNYRMKELNDKFNTGKLTVQEYNKQVMDLQSNLDKISTMDSVFIGIESGASAAIKKIGTLSQQIGKVIEGVFDKLEDTLFTFIKTGEFEFKKFVEAVLDDLTRVAIRMAIIRPLAGAIAGDPAAGGGVTPSANGNVFNGGSVVPFAHGGVVSRASLFPMANGRTGLMGEKGPEAIMPLKRDASGRLGVSGSSTTVNVYNNSSNTTAETRKTNDSNGNEKIDIVIIDKINKAIGEGKLDRALGQTYGLNRRGF